MLKSFVFEEMYLKIPNLTRFQACRGPPSVSGRPGRRGRPRPSPYCYCCGGVTRYVEFGDVCRRYCRKISVGEGPISEPCEPKQSGTIRWFRPLRNDSNFEVVDSGYSSHLGLTVYGWLVEFSNHPARPYFRNQPLRLNILDNGVE